MAGTGQVVVWLTYTGWHVWLLLAIVHAVVQTAVGTVDWLHAVGVRVHSKRCWQRCLLWLLHRAVVAWPDAGWHVVHRVVDDVSAWQYAGRRGTCSRRIARQAGTDQRAGRGRECCWCKPGTPEREKAWESESDRGRGADPYALWGLVTYPDDENKNPLCGGGCWGGGTLAVIIPCALIRYCCMHGAQEQLGCTIRVLSAFDGELHWDKSGVGSERWEWEIADVWIHTREHSQSFHL